MPCPEKLQSRSRRAANGFTSPDERARDGAAGERGSIAFIASSNQNIATAHSPPLHNNHSYVKHHGAARQRPGVPAPEGTPWDGNDHAAGKGNSSRQPRRCSWDPGTAGRSQDIYSAQGTERRSGDAALRPQHAGNSTERLRHAPGPHPRRQQPETPGYAGRTAARTHPAAGKGSAAAAV